MIESPYQCSGRTVRGRVTGVEGKYSLFEVPIQDGEVQVLKIPMRDIERILSHTLDCDFMPNIQKGINTGDCDEPCKITLIGKGYCTQEKEGGKLEPHPYGQDLDLKEVLDMGIFHKREEEDSYDFLTLNKGSKTWGSINLMVAPIHEDGTCVSYLGSIDDKVLYEGKLPVGDDEFDFFVPRELPPTSPFKDSGTWKGYTEIFSKYFGHSLFTCIPYGNNFIAHVQDKNSDKDVPLIDSDMGTPTHLGQYLLDNGIYIPQRKNSRCKKPLF